MKSLDIYNNIKYLSIFNEIKVFINKVTIDTRKISNNDCYIGIKGDKNDGNLFYMDAFNKGASLVILENFIINDEIMDYIKNNNKSLKKINLLLFEYLTPNSLFILHLLLLE